MTPEVSMDKGEAGFAVSWIRRRARERPGFVLMSIVLTGLLLRVALFAIVWGHPGRVLQVDSFDYLTLGRSFSESVVHGVGPGMGLSVFRPPGYPAFIALIHLLSSSI